MNQNIAKTINRIVRDMRPEMGYDFVRIFLGVGLIFKAIQFMSDPATLLNLINQSQVQMIPTFLLFYIPVVHLFGGAMLSLGFLTRFSALIQLPVLFGAVFFIHFNPNIIFLSQEFEFAVLVLILLIVFLIFGSGALSFDYQLSQNKR
jgi:uncharacterized membrane protein YphA (DoxX/SURF4 family)